MSTAEVLGWSAAVLGGWLVIALPGAVLLGRYLRDRAPSAVPDPRPGPPAPDRHNEGASVDFSDLTDIDATDLLDKAATFTSNLGAVLHGLIDAGEQGVDVLLENLRPLAEQADAFLGNADNPVPAPPAGGVPVDAPVADSPAEAAATVGVTTGTGFDSSTSTFPDGTTGPGVTS